MQHQYAPQQYEDYAKFSPMYDAIDMQRMATMLPQMQTINDELSKYSYGQMKQYNPELYANLNKLDQGSELNKALESQARSQLELGGSLSAQDLRDSQQQARMGSEARGLSGTNASLVTEALNTDALRRQRMGERQQFAQGVDNANFNRLTTATNARAAMAYNPTTQTFNTAGGILGQNSQQVNGMFNPYNQYAQDYYNTQYNGQMSQYNTAQNNAAATKAGNTQAAAGIGGALLVAF